MDALSLIVTAVVTGAALGLKPTAEQAVKDGYAALKRLLIDRYGDQGEVAEAVQKVEAKQDADWPREMLREELGAAGAAEDRELLRRAQALLKAAQPESDASVTVTASDHSVTVGGSVGGSVTNIHGDGNVVGDHSESNVRT
ncbi:MAG: hypothetical protein ACP5HM_05550 [Anaerolineae bacterium]